MTVSKISVACWVLFCVMCVAFLPLGIGILSVHAIPAAPRVALAIVAVAGLWWGPFAYAMYLSMAVMRNGDHRLLRRGIAGTAEVLSVKRTNTVIQEGEFAWEAPRVYKYSLRVSIPGRQPYETSCSVCAAGIREGAVVNVAVSRHNRKRVTIDVSQGSNNNAGPPRPAAPGFRAAQRFQAVQDFQAHDFQPQGFPGARGFPAAGAGAASASGPGWQEFPPSRDNQRLGALAQLSELHQQGVLTDAEFAAQKARILAE